MINLYKKLFHSVILVSGKSAIWKDTCGCAKHYQYDLLVYCIAVLSDNNGIILNCFIGPLCHINYLVDCMDAI